jgi:hypothetical protein
MADLDTLRRAIEQSDPELLISLYAEDAELKIVDRNYPPSKPYILHGREAIAEYLQDISSRDMTHHLEQAVVGQDHLAFTEACRYADGTRVLCSSMLNLKAGKIAQQLNVQAWDE